MFQTELALNENYLVGTIPLELSHLRMIGESQNNKHRHVE